MKTLVSESKNHPSLNLIGLLLDQKLQLRLRRFSSGIPTRAKSPATTLRLFQTRPPSMSLLLMLLMTGCFVLTAIAVEPLGTWSPRTSPYGTTNHWRAVAFGNDRFVAVNQSAGLVITSSNGTDWTPQSANTNKAFYGLAFGNGKFVASGASGLIMTSTNGTGWQPQASGTSAHLYHVNYGNGQFVAVGDGGTVLASPNGTTWTPHNNGNTNKWNASAFGNGTHVVVGYRTQSPTSYTRSAASPDFSNWDLRDTGPTFYLSGITFGLGKFVAVGYGGTIQTATDGANWSAPSNPVFAWLYEVAFANDTFIAVGENVITSSTNGTTWLPRFSQSGKTMHGLAFGANTWVVVGSNGLILQSDPVGESSDAVMLFDAERAGTTFSFKFNGTIGQNYQVQTSTDLVNWSSLANIACTNATTSCTLTGQNSQHQCYRIERL